jgi:hypothetical protein
MRLGCFLSFIQDHQGRVGEWRVEYIGNSTPFGFPSKVLVTCVTKPICEIIEDVRPVY